MPLDETIVADVANSNFKVIANATASGIAQAGSLAALNAAANQHSLNLISQAFLAEAILPRAVGSKKIAEADLARTVDELGTAISALQQIIKTAQSTPPTTP